MRTRLALVAAAAFSLGVAVDRFARITGYDRLIATMQERIDTQQSLIGELESQQAEINAILRESRE